MGAETLEETKPSARQASTAGASFLVTGAHGFIGAWVTKRLLDAGARIVIFDRDADPRRLRLIMDEEEVARTRVRTGDITDARALPPVFEEFEVEHVIHLAGLQVPTCRADPRAGALVNVVGTINVFEAARYAGVRVSRYQIMFYVFLGALAGLAGAIESARLVTGQPTAGEGYELRVIAAVVIGGGSLSGGQGSVVGTLVGALIMGVLSNGANLLGISSFTQQIVIGAVIVLAVTFDEFQRRRFESAAS